MADLDDLALEVPCPRCESKVGEGCRTITGHPCSIHSGRIMPLLHAFWLGRDKEREWSAAEAGTTGEP